MKKLWKFVSTPRNLAVLVALGGALGFLITQVLLPRRDPSHPADAGASQEARADGGTAINASGQSQVGVGRPSTTAPASPESMPSTSTDTSTQRAQAGSGGVAINASDSAHVQVGTDSNPSRQP